MLLYEVGKPFPEPKMMACDGFRARPMEGGGLDVIGYLGNPSSNEVKEFKGGIIRYGVFVQRSIPFLLFQFRDIDLEFDTQINMHKVAAGGRQAWIDSEANLLTLYLVDLRDNVLKAMRAVGMEHEVVRTMREACRQQLEVYPDAQAVDREMDRTYTALSISDMLKRAKLHTLIR